METDNKNIVSSCLRHYFNNNYEVNLLTNHEASFFLYLKIFIWKKDMNSLKDREKEMKPYTFLFYLKGEHIL